MECSVFSFQFSVVRERGLALQLRSVFAPLLFSFSPLLLFSS